MDDCTHEPDDQNEEPEINLSALPNEKLVQYARLHDLETNEKISRPKLQSILTQHVKSSPIDERDIINNFCARARSAAQ